MGPELRGGGGEGSVEVQQKAYVSHLFKAFPKKSKIDKQDK